MVVSCLDFGVLSVSVCYISKTAVGERRSRRNRCWVKTRIAQLITLKNLKSSKLSDIHYSLMMMMKMDIGRTWIGKLVQPCLPSLLPTMPFSTFPYHAFLCILPTTSLWFSLPSFFLCSPSSLSVFLRHSSVVHSQDFAHDTCHLCLLLAFGFFLFGDICFCLGIVLLACLSVTLP